jgi:hypothetical protein
VWQGTPSNSFVSKFIAANRSVEDVSMTESINLTDAATQSDTNDEIISQLNLLNALVSNVFGQLYFSNNPER